MRAFTSLHLTEKSVNLPKCDFTRLFKGEGVTFFLARRSFPSGRRLARKKIGRSARRKIACASTDGSKIEKTRGQNDHFAKTEGYTYRSRRTNEDHILIQSFPYVHVLEEGLRIFFNVRYEPTVSLTQSLTGSAYERQVSYHTAVPDASSGPKKACMPILRRFSRTTRGDFSHSCEYCMVCWKFTAEELSRNVRSLVVAFFVKGHVSDKERTLKFSGPETCC